MSELTDALDKKGQDMEALHRCTKILSHPLLSSILSSPILSCVRSHRLRHRDMEQVERDGLMEVRRLRVQLNSAEQEVNEVGGPSRRGYRGGREHRQIVTAVCMCVWVCACMCAASPDGAHPAEGAAGVQEPPHQDAVVVLLQRGRPAAGAQGGRGRAVQREEVAPCADSAST